MYKFISVISVVIRMFCLPNPFEPLNGKYTFMLLNAEIPITADIINWVAEALLHFIAFNVTGLYYSKGRDNPAKGSFLYLFFYCVHVGLIYVLSSLDFALWAIILVLITYIAAHVGINTFKNKFIM